MPKYFDVHNHLFNKNFLAKELLYRLMKELKKSSYYLDLELPMLEHYRGVNVIPMFPTRP